MTPLMTNIVENFPSFSAVMEGSSFLLLHLVRLFLVGLFAGLIYKNRGVLFTIQRPISGSSMWGLVSIPEGQCWSVCNQKGELRTVEGPAVLRVIGARLVELTQMAASNAEYLLVQFRDGRTEIIPGPAVVYRDHSIHKEIRVQKAVNLTEHEVLVVYREEEATEEKESSTSSSGETKEQASAARKMKRKETTNSGKSTKVTRSLVTGPCLHVPQNASEWTHEFSWHGSTTTGVDEVNRKVRNALKFKKLRTCPDQTYYDVEGVRTKDDALVTVKLMIFFRLDDIDLMLRETHDPMADFINAVSSDVIEFVAGKSFEEFKQATNQLNELEVYKQLAHRAKAIGFEVTKVVFRGYFAPLRLQKMHDDAIERRTKLALERETEDQEQQLLDMKLDKEEDRERRRRQMETDAKAHEREMQKLTFDAFQEEQRLERNAKHAHLLWMQKELGVPGDQLSSYLLAMEQGPPAKLIQINGCGKNAGGSSTPGFVHLPVEDRED